MTSKITKPGIYKLPAETYHSDPAPEPSLSASVAWTLLSKSPLHAFTESPRLNPEFEREEKDIYDLGSAAHNMVLRQDYWREEIDIITGFDDWKKKAARDAKAASREAGRYPILEKNYASLERMVTVLEQHPEAGNAFRNGKPEQSLFWQDKETGIWMRCRPDWTPDDAKAPWPDYKTTGSKGDANIPTWERNFLQNHGGLLRAGLYVEGVETLTGVKNPTKYYVIQEAKPPYAIVIRVMPIELIALGRRMLRKAKVVWAECLATGNWPSYELIGELSLSRWMQERWEVEYEEWGEPAADKTTGYEPHEVLVP